MKVIFDTNAYRYVAAGRSTSKVRALTSVVVEKERDHQITAYAAPIVWLELFNHLEDKSDPHFWECLHGLVFGYLHTHEIQQDGIAWRLCPNVHMLMEQTLFGSWDPQEAAVVQQMDDIAISIYNNPTPNVVLSQQSKMKPYWEMLRKDEANFVESLNELAKEYHSRYPNEKNIVKRLRASPIINSMCTASVIGAARAHGLQMGDLNQESVSAWAQRIKTLFPAPFELYMEILSRLVTHANFDISKDSRRNWYWDFQLLFYLHPANDFVLVTDDRDITNAARAAAVGHKVKTLKQYLEVVNIDLEK